MLFKLIVMLLIFFKLKSVYVQISFVRILVQFISYDILIIIIFVFYVLIMKNFNLISCFLFSKYFILFFFNFYFLLFWFLSVLMEIMRLPFDFYESESELISGFNLELGSFYFIVLFIIEYLDMIFFINLSSLLFFYIYGLFFFNLFILIFIL